MPLMPIFKGYLLNKGSTLKPKGNDNIELGLITHQDDKMVVDVVGIKTW
jgi:hypothetical protein